MTGERTDDQFHGESIVPSAFSRRWWLREQRYEDSDDGFSPDSRARQKLARCDSETWLLSQARNYSPVISCGGESPRKRISPKYRANDYRKEFTGDVIPIASWKPKVLLIAINWDRRNWRKSIMPACCAPVSVVCWLLSVGQPYRTRSVPIQNPFISKTPNPLKTLFAKWCQN